MGRAYGLEVLLKKTGGPFTGWIAYTLSKSEQRTPGRDANELGINFGRWYRTPYDKTHDVAVFGNMVLSSKWRLSANFIYQTGQPVNYPIGQFQFQELVVPYFGPRNEQRLPDYHRLDISATLTPKLKREKKWRGEWVFSLYNVYNRRNAASINFRQNEDTGVNEAVRTSIFSIVPAVTYNFKF